MDATTVAPLECLRSGFDCQGLGASANYGVAHSDFRWRDSAEHPGFVDYPDSKLIVRLLRRKFGAVLESPIQNVAHDCCLRGSWGPGRVTNSRFGSGMALATQTSRSEHPVRDRRTPTLGTVRCIASHVRWSRRLGLISEALRSALVTHSVDDLDLRRSVGMGPNALAPESSSRKESAGTAAKSACGAPSDARSGRVYSPASEPNSADHVHELARSGSVPGTLPASVSDRAISDLPSSRPHPRVAHGKSRADS